MRRRICAPQVISAGTLRTKDRMWKKVIFAACAAVVVLIARMGFCANIGIVPKQPQGFRFGNGRLLPWGASKDDLIAMLPPQPLRADVAKLNQDSYAQCEASLQEVQKITGAPKPFDPCGLLVDNKDAYAQCQKMPGTAIQPASPPVDTCGVVLDTNVHRVVWCSNQQPPAPDTRDADSLIAGQGKEMIDRVAGGDGCVVSAQALPIPYHGLALLAFNRNRFFRINVELATKDFDDIERSMIDSLGKPRRRAVGTAQNGFGASFDTVDDTWQVGSVSVLLSKRVGDVDHGALVLTYLPLAENAPERPVVPPPF